MTGSQQHGPQAQNPALNWTLCPHLSSILSSKTLILSWLTSGTLPIGEKLSAAYRCIINWGRNKVTLSKSKRNTIRSTVPSQGKVILTTAAYNNHYSNSLRYKSLVFWLYADPQQLNPRLDDRVTTMIDVSMRLHVIRCNQLFFIVTVDGSL